MTVFVTSNVRSSCQAQASLWQAPDELATDVRFFLFQKPARPPYVRAIIGYGAGARLLERFQLPTN